jgi:hypothetical protein
MQRVNEFNLYDLSRRVHSLTQAAQEGVKFRDVWYPWWDARVALEEILQARPLSVCAAAARRLRGAITAGIPEKWEDVSSVLSGGKAEELLPGWVPYEVQEAANEFETVLAAECQVLDTYLISKKGAYSTADLVEHAHRHIPEPTRRFVPQQTKDDFDQAGKCMAFDLATATAFHLLRGTEAVLRQYYEKVVPGPKRAPAKMRNWGVYIRLLVDNGADSKVISLLTHLKDAYRNPVLHPEENYTDERAQVLFGVCVSAIAVMVEELTKAAATSATLQFPTAGTGPAKP